MDKFRLHIPRWNIISTAFDIQLKGRPGNTLSFKIVIGADMGGKAVIKVPERPHFLAADARDLHPDFNIRASVIGFLIVADGRANIPSRKTLISLKICWEHYPMMCFEITGTLLLSAYPKPLIEHAFSPSSP